MRQQRLSVEALDQAGAAVAQRRQNVFHKHMPDVVVKVFEKLRNDGAIGILAGRSNKGVNHCCCQPGKVGILVDHRLVVAGDQIICFVTLRERGPSAGSGVPVLRIKVP